MEALDKFHGVTDKFGDPNLVKPWIQKEQCGFDPEHGIVD